MSLKLANMPRITIMKSGGPTPAKAAEMLKDGTAHGKPLTDKQKRYFGMLSHPTAEYGMPLKNLGGGVQKYQGPSHAEGGIDVDGKGVPTSMSGSKPKVEVEGGETLMNNEDVMSKTIRVPGLKKTYAQVSELLAEKESKVKKLMDKGSELVTSSNPENKWELLKHNTGSAYMKMSIAKLNEIGENKQHLVDLQRTGLDFTDKMVINPEKYFNHGVITKADSDDKAKYGRTLPDNKTGLSKFGQSHGTNNHTGLGSSAIAKGPVPLAKAQFGVTTSTAMTEEPTNTDRLSPAKRNNNDEGSIAVKHRNPGNIIYTSDMASKYGAQRGSSFVGGDGKTYYYSKFPNFDVGKKALLDLLTGPGYSSLTLGEVANKWTGGQPWGNIPDDLRNRKISDIAQNKADLYRAADVVSMGEDGQTYFGTRTIGRNVPKENRPNFSFSPETGRYYKNEEDVSSYTPPVISKTTPTNSTDISGKDKEALGNITDTPPNKVIPSTYDYTQYKNPIGSNNVPKDIPLEMQQILPEMYTVATNKVRPVWMQQFKPQLYQPYNVSFQDKLNEDRAQFKDVQRIAGNNPAALATLSGQEYAAANSVLGEQFRTNQQISNDITNKNIGLLNEAQNENLKLADTQYVRQETARSKTKEQNYAALQSISDKILEREAANREMKIYANYYPYFKFNSNTQQSEYVGPTMEESSGSLGQISGVGGMSRGIGPATSVRRSIDPNTGKERDTYVTPGGYQTRKLFQQAYKPEITPIPRETGNIIHGKKYGGEILKRKYGGNVSRRVNSLKKAGVHTMGMSQITPI